MRRVLTEADPGFVAGCLASGLSSGEGVIAQVRDQLDDTEDHAPADKRRLVLEQEFAQVLKVLSREGNTLSPIVRQAWDAEALQTMVRNNPLRATAAHVGIIGHITKDELLRYLTATELANGFSNRFLVLAVDRSKLLPFGSAIDDAQLAELPDAVRRALRFAGTDRPLAFDQPRAIGGSRLPGAVGQPALARGGRHGTGRSARRPSRVDLRTPGLLGPHRPPAPRGRLAVWRYSADSARGSSATASATLPPTTSGRPPRSAPPG